MKFRKCVLEDELPHYTKVNFRAKNVEWPGLGSCPNPPIMFALWVARRGVAAHSTSTDIKMTN
jgi:hypothetical protein